MAKSSLQAPKGSGLKKGRWTVQEDKKLIRYMEGIEKHDKKSKRGGIFWQEVPKRSGLNRDWKSCWLRWGEHLERSGIKKGKFSEDEDNKILELRPSYGNKWSNMAADHFPHRTGNEIKNRWHNNLKKNEKTDIHGTPKHTPVVQPLIAGTSFHTPLHTPVVHPLIVPTGFPISSTVNYHQRSCYGLEGFDYNITPQFTNGLPLPLHSQGPSSFNNLTMDDQFGPLIIGGVPITGSISNPQVSNNYPMDVCSIPVKELSDNLWAICELNGLDFNSTIPAQALPISTIPSQVPDDFNYHVFDFSSTIPSQTLLSIDNFSAQANQLKPSPNEKAYLEFVPQELLMNVDDYIYTDDPSSGDLDSWMALISF